MGYSQNSGWGESITLNAYFRNEERFQIFDVNFHLKKLKTKQNKKTANQS